MLIRRCVVVMAATAALSTVACGGSGVADRPVDPEPVITTAGGPVPVTTAEIEREDPALDDDGIELAAPPYTAEQIRDATRMGRTYTFLMQELDKPDTYMRLAFIEVSDDGATIERTILGADGKAEQGTMRVESTWDELVAHASYPAASTDITEETVDTPAGSFECFVYSVTVDSADGKLWTHVYFAKSMPGAPVLLIVEIDGRWSSTMTLTDFTPGS